MTFSMYSCRHVKSFLSQARERFVIGPMSKQGQDKTSKSGDTRSVQRMSRH